MKIAGGLSPVCQQDRSAAKLQLCCHLVGGLVITEPVRHFELAASPAAVAEHSAEVLAEGYMNKHSSSTSLTP